MNKINVDSIRKDLAKHKAEAEVVRLNFNCIEVFFTTHYHEEGYYGTWFNNDNLTAPERQEHNDKKLTRVLRALRDYSYSQGTRKEYFGMGEDQESIVTIQEVFRIHLSDTRFRWQAHGRKYA